MRFYSATRSMQVFGDLWHIEDAVGEGDVVVLATVDTGSLSPTVFTAMSTVAVVVSLAMARAWDRVAKALVPRAGAWGVLVLVTLVTLVGKLAFTDPLVLTLTCAVGQLALCCLLIVQRRSPS